MLITQEPTEGFAIIGDTQKTLAYEIIVGKEADNHEERLKLIAAGGGKS